MATYNNNNLHDHQSGWISGWQWRWGDGLKNTLLLVFVTQKPSCVCVTSCSRTWWTKHILHLCSYLEISGSMEWKRRQFLSPRSIIFAASFFWILRHSHNALNRRQITVTPVAELKCLLHFREEKLERKQWGGGGGSCLIFFPYYIHMTVVASCSIFYTTIM